MDKSVRLGLVGAGAWGRNYLRTVEELQGVELAAVVSQNPDTPALAGKHCLVVPDYKILEPELIDGIIIATPPAIHGEVARWFMERGVPALIEKPLTLDPKEARELGDLAKQTGVHVRVGHVHLYGPAFQKLKALAGSLDDGFEIMSEAGNRGPIRSDVNVLWDWGPHDVSMILDLSGRAPSQCEAECVGTGSDDVSQGQTIHLSMAWENGSTAEVRLSNRRDRKCRYFQITRRSETLIYDDLSDSKLVMRTNDFPTGRPIAIDTQMPLTALVSKFAESIRNGDQEQADLQLAIRVVETLDRFQAQI